MLTLAACCALIGILAGLRFRVFVLLPLIALTLTAITILNLSQQATLLTSVIDGAIVVIATDVGYACGAAVRVLLFSPRDTRSVMSDNSDSDDQQGPHQD